MGELAPSNKFDVLSTWGFAAKAPDSKNYNVPHKIAAQTTLAKNQAQLAEAANFSQAIANQQSAKNNQHQSNIALSFNPNQQTPSNTEQSNINDQQNPVETVSVQGVENDNGGQFSFWDVVDILNPLHHIPGVNYLYSQITGDEISLPSRLAGSTLYGGPVGLAFAAADSLVEAQSGSRAIEHVAAIFGLNNTAPAAPIDDNNIEKQNTVDVLVNRKALNNPEFYASRNAAPVAASLNPTQLEFSEAYQQSIQSALRPELNIKTFNQPQNSLVGQINQPINTSTSKREIANTIPFNGNLDFRKPPSEVTQIASLASSVAPEQLPNKNIAPAQNNATQSPSLQLTPQTNQALQNWVDKFNQKHSSHQGVANNSRQRNILAQSGFDEIGRPKRNNTRAVAYKSPAPNSQQNPAGPQEAGSAIGIPQNPYLIQSAEIHQKMLAALEKYEALKNKKF